MIDQGRTPALGASSGDDHFQVLHYRTLVESSKDALLAVSLDRVVLAWNRQAKEMFGYASAEAIGSHVDRLLLHESRKGDFDKLFQRVASGECFRLQKAILHCKNDRQIHAILSAEPILDFSGQVVGASLSACEFSEQRRTPDHFRIAVEASPSGMLQVDPDGRIQLVNAEIERLFGYARDELIGNPIELLIPERFCSRHPELRAEFIGNPSARSMGVGRDLFGRRRDGTEFPVEVGLNPVLTTEGLRVLCAVIDLTERNAADELFHMAVEASPSGVVLVDEDGRIVLVNAETERLFRYARDELIGKSIDILVPKRYQQDHPQRRAEFSAHPIRRGMGIGRDLFALRRDGVEFPVEVGLNPIPTAHGVRVLCVVIDITARKAAEQALNEQRAELERSNAELEQFAYVASHDLREPLRMVASYSRLFAERFQGAIDEKADKYIGYMVEGATRMQQLVDDLLAISRVGSQGKPLVPVDAGNILAETLIRLTPLIEEAGAQIAIASDMPVVYADDVQLAQVFQNLISNAVKFRSSEPPKVQISANAVHGQCLFRVQDNGIGIDLAYAKKVFQMFQRLHGRGEYDGSGIGLAIAKRIVERHGGRIWFESKVGEGAVFFFTMKAAS